VVVDEIEVEPDEEGVMVAEAGGERVAESSLTPASTEGALRC